MIVNKVVELLKEKNLTIGSIESLTGGLFASMITEVPGVSKVYRGSVVSYATEVKKDVVGVNEKVIETNGVVSKECALEMAKSGQQLLKTDIMVSFTGNAGPDVLEGKDAGLVYIAIAIKKDIEVFELRLIGARDIVRKKCVEYAFEKLFEKLSRTFKKNHVIN